MPQPLHPLIEQLTTPTIVERNAASISAARQVIGIQNGVFRDTDTERGCELIRVYPCQIVLTHQSHHDARIGWRCHKVVDMPICCVEIMTDPVNYTRSPEVAHSKYREHAKVLTL